MPVRPHYDKIATDDKDTRPVASPMTAPKGLAICAVLVVIALQAMGLWLVARLQHSRLQRYVPPCQCSSQRSSLLTKANPDNCSASSVDTVSTSFHLEPAFSGISDAPTVEKAWKIYDLRKFPYTKSPRPTMKPRVYY